MTRRYQAEDLARAAAERAAALAIEAAERTQAHAVARAIRDVNIDRDLLDHGSHLKEINGSQSEMALRLTSVDHKLDRLATSLQEQMIANDARAAEREAARQQGEDKLHWRLSRRTIWLTLLGVIAAYGAIMATLLTGVGHS